MMAFIFIKLILGLKFSLQKCLICRCGRCVLVCFMKLIFIFALNNHTHLSVIVSVIVTVIVFFTSLTYTNETEVYPLKALSAHSYAWARIHLLPHPLEHLAPHFQYVASYHFNCHIIIIQDCHVCMRNIVFL